MPNRAYLSVIAVFAIAFTSACSTRQVYSTGLAWQRSECYKMADDYERGRCLSSASTSYEEYRRQTEAMKGPN